MANKQSLLSLVTGVLWILSAQTVALEIPLYVDESAGVERWSEPVTTGVPLQRGSVRDLQQLSIHTRSGESVPAQFRRLSSWPDGSCKWVLVDFQADVAADGRQEYILSDVGEPARHAHPVEVLHEVDAVVIDNGVINLSVSRTKFSLLSSLSVHDQSILGPASGVRVFPAEGAVTIEALPPESITIEESGPLRAAIRVTGRFRADEGRLEYICTITVFAGQELVRVRFWLRNTGAYGYNLPQGQSEWFPFDGVTLDLDLKPLLQSEEVHVVCEGVDSRVGGGDEWRVAQYGEDPDYDSMHFVIERNGERLAAGHHTAGVTRILSGPTTLTVAVRHFWQNYEKAITLQDQCLSLWLWPRFGEWPRTGSSRGASDEGPRRASTYHLPGGTQKSYEILLDLRPGISMEQSAASLEQPLMALASAAHFASTEAFGLFAEGGFAPEASAAAEVLAQQNAWARNVFDPAARASIHESRRGSRHGYWFGWMDFGDLNWDSARGRGPSSLHYDWTWIAMLDYVRLRDRFFFDVGDEMARHRMDVDQRWSDGDHVSYRGLSAFEMNQADIHGGNQDGHTSPNPTHNWISGLVFYHLLTGDLMAREAALRNCDVGIYPRLIERLQTGRVGIDQQPRESGWSIANLVAAYELTGDSKYLDWALVCWNLHLKPRWRRDGVSFEKGAYGLQMFYCTHGLIGLHRWTQNPEILEYIEAAVHEVDAAPRGQWQFGRELGSFFSDYWGYLAAVKDEPAYLRKGREYLRMRIPSTAEERVFDYGSRTITKEVAKALRNGHVLQWAEERLADLHGVDEPGGRSAP
jgi:hypothetical protein